MKRSARLRRPLRRILVVECLRLDDDDAADCAMRLLGGRGAVGDQVREVPAREAVHDYPDPVGP